LLACLPAAADGLLERVEKDCAALTARIEEFLGPKFRGPVPVRIVDKAFIVEFARDLERRMAPSGMAAAGQMLAERLHQIPKGYDLAAATLRMFETGVAGLYDAEKDCFYVVDSVGAPGTPVFRITVAHELVHAYRDVDKDYWPRLMASAFSDADWAIAVSCLVEGDAQLLGTAIGLAAVNDEPLDAFLAAQLKRAASGGDGAREAFAAALADFPLALREMFATRYVIGEAFAAAVYAQGGKEALAAAYDRPPRSTEQVLHPARYLGPEVDEPTVFDGGDPTGVLGDGYRLVIANVMGEFEMGIHFTEILGREWAERAARGWDGARYHLCAREGEPPFFGMVTTWDAWFDAWEFAHAWAGWASRRDGKTRGVRIDRDGFTVKTDEGLVVVRIRGGKDVLVADGVPEERVEPVLAALASAARSDRAPDATPLGSDVR
jgi:hypothetical protein